MFLVALGVLALAGCEPYMSMTDQIPAQTRRAAALLPEMPRYVGMVDVETALRHLKDLRGENLADSLRQTDDPHLRAFLDATGLDPKRDVQAAYGALGGEDAFSAVLFANITTEQMDRYLKEAPGGGGRATTYRDVPLYHLTFGATDDASTDTLSVAFVEEGMMAVATKAGRVTAMIDRHKAPKQAGLRANESYMTLVKRVGHGSTAWLVGRDVVQSALRDTATHGRTASSTQVPRVSQAGLQHALADWTDRVLGLSEVSSFGGRAGKKVNRLKERLREQALSITLTETTLQGEVYLTMRDNASASSVVDVAEGAVAVMRLSEKELDKRQRDLLDEIEIERNGTIVHVHFALDRDLLREEANSEPRATAVRRADSSTRQPTVTIRRFCSINHDVVPFQPEPTICATESRVGLSTPVHCTERQG